MGQKVRPTGFRVGVMETWRSRWYASKREFGDLLIEDQKIRKFVATKYEFAEIARVEIERTRDQVVVHMHTARPGVIIGRKGQEVDKLKAELEDLTGRRMDVKIVEITNPNRNSRLVAMKIAQQLQKRGSFRRAIKKTLDEVMSAGVYGVKIQMSGRLGGAEIARTERYHEGKVPLHTLRTPIDYGFTEAETVAGKIGIKCWICKKVEVPEEPRAEVKPPVTADAAE